MEWNADRVKAQLSYAIRRDSALGTSSLLQDVALRECDIIAYHNILIIEETTGTVNPYLDSKEMLRDVEIARNQRLQELAVHHEWT